MPPARRHRLGARYLSSARTDARTSGEDSFLDGIRGRRGRRGTIFLIRRVGFRSIEAVERRRYTSVHEYDIFFLAHSVHDTMSKCQKKSNIKILKGQRITGNDSNHVGFFWGWTIGPTTNVAGIVSRTQ